MGLRGELRKAKKGLQWVESDLSKKTNDDFARIDMERTYVNGLNTFSKRFEKTVRYHESNSRRTSEQSQISVTSSMS
jgi:hypothetical protein